MAPIDPRLVIHNRVNTKASLVTKDAARIYGSQWKTKLIEGKVTKVDKRIPEGKSRSATYIEVDWELPGRVIRKELMVAFLLFRKMNLCRILVLSYSGRRSVFCPIFLLN